MDKQIFDALKIPDGAETCVIEPPEIFPEDFDFTDTPGSSFDFVPVFITDPEFFAEEVAEAVRISKEGGMVWAITPKEADADFSMDFMKQQSAPLGVAPSQQINLNDAWTATLIEIV